MIAQSFLALAAFLVFLQVLSIALAAVRCNPRHRAKVSGTPPPVSIIRPLAGAENNLEEMVRSNFTLDHAPLELMFCVDRADDPAAPIAQRLIDEHPHVDARLLVGEDRFSINPKLNNCSKGWHAARHDLVIIADSNVMMPPDYVAQLLEPLLEGADIVCSPPIGASPHGLAAEIECAFLNSLQARLLYAGDTLRLKPVHGKSMIVRKSWLDMHGGLHAMATCLAEDVALRKLSLRCGAKVRLVRTPFRQLIGRRSMRQVLARQRRWALLRRLASPLNYPMELLMSGIGLAVLAAAAAHGAGIDPWPVGGVAALLIYGAELALAKRSGWIYSWRTPVAIVLRDLLLPLVWINGLTARNYRWGQYVVRTRYGSATLDEQSA